MVKKISGKPPTATSESSRIQSSREVTATHVGTVGQVSETQAKKGVARAQGSAARITAKHREQLYQIIEEEADKMLREAKITATKKAVIKGAVRMAIDAATVGEEEEQ